MVHLGKRVSALGAESGSELSCRDATGTDTMTETVPIDRPPAARATVSRSRSRKPATVSASALAAHLDCSRQYICKLEAEGVIQRQDDGFPLDQSRVAYLRYMRRERRQSPRSEADADHVKVKTEMLQLRLMEKKRQLVVRGHVNVLLDEICGVTLTHLSGLAARCSNDLTVLRKISMPPCVRSAPRLPNTASRSPTNAANRPWSSGLTMWRMSSADYWLPPCGRLVSDRSASAAAFSKTTGPGDPHKPMDPLIHVKTAYLASPDGWWCPVHDRG
jgi:hypothetical protein